MDNHILKNLTSKPIIIFNNFIFHPTNRNFIVTWVIYYKYYQTQVILIVQIRLKFNQGN